MKTANILAIAIAAALPGTALHEQTSLHPSRDHDRVVVSSHVHAHVCNG
jgi:hypothetical protein